MRRAVFILSATRSKNIRSTHSQKREWERDGERKDMLLYSRGQRYSSVLNEIIITKRQKRYKSTELFFIFFSFCFCIFVVSFIISSTRNKVTALKCLLFILVAHVCASEWLLRLYYRYYYYYYYILYIPYYDMRLIAWQGLTRLLHYYTAGGLCVSPALLLFLLRFLFMHF